jgi:hypothetical protein
LPKGDNSLLGSKKTTFSSGYEMCLFGLLFLSELGTCPQNLMPTQGVEPWEDHQFPQGGYAEIHIQRPFFDNINFYFLFLKDTKISIFGGISKFRLWADYGSFGQNLLHWQWLTACPKITWNLKNLITFEP